MDFVSRLEDAAIVPVVEIEDEAMAVPLGKTLATAGFSCVEITFRTPAAAAAIRALRAGCPDLLVGAGTVLNENRLEAALESGAQFLVAPGFRPALVATALSMGIPMVPGVCTPTEIESAMETGVRVLKFFPAELAGGVPFLKAVAAVYPEARFLPTGGIGPANLGAYLALPNVIACGGSWMVRREWISAGDLDAIGRAAREARSLALDARARAAAERAR
jgi:2-dehydro-3-deoxyphosphogluconate aldolase/(4S)-4-hydroxy-2-oxoglutarate aldolase